MILQKVKVQNALIIMQSCFRVKLKIKLLQQQKKY